MENLIKAILDQLAILIERKRATPPQELIKTLPNGQWEVLIKGGVIANIPKGTCTCGAHKTQNTNMHSDWCDGVAGGKGNTKLDGSNKKFTELFGQLNNHVKSGNHAGVAAARGAIRSYALGLPKGQIDLGHIGKLREQSEKHKDPSTGPLYPAMRPITHDDIGEIMNHHTGDAKSLKEIHDNNGGLDAVETVLRAHGADGARHYDPNAHKNFQIFGDVYSLMRPERFTGPQFENWDTGQTHDATYHKTPNDPALQKEFVDAHNDLMSTHNPKNYGLNADEKTYKRVDNAAVKRALDRFKRHHKL